MEDFAMATNNRQLAHWATDAARTERQLSNCYTGLNLQPPLGQQGAPQGKEPIGQAVLTHLAQQLANNRAAWQPPTTPRPQPRTPAPVPVRREFATIWPWIFGLLMVVLAASVLWFLWTRPPQVVEKEVIKTVEVLVTAQPRQTEELAQPTAPATGGICSAYKVDFPFHEGNPGNVIDFRSPRERMIGNFWLNGKEVTYVTGRGIVIRAFFIGYGNYWKFPDDCDSENLVERGIQYAKDTTSSNHTGEVWLVNPDGSLSLITKDAFGYDLSTLPADPTK